MDSAQLVEIFELQMLKSRYFRCLDTKDWAGYRALFTDDLIFYMEDALVPTSTEPITTNADDYVEFVSEFLTPSTTVHHGHMPELTLTGDRTATGVWAMYDWVDSPREDAARVGFGHYHEKYAKGEDGQWRIAELRLTRIRVDPVAASPRDKHRPAPPVWQRPSGPAA
jgi:hypothetical protein